MQRLGKYLIVADVVDEEGKWVYTRPVKDEPVFEDRAAALARADELDRNLTFSRADDLKRKLASKEGL